MRIVKWLVTLTAAIAIASGCTRAVNTTERAAPFGEPDPVKDKRISGDSSLDEKARIISINETVVSGDLVKVQVEILNTRAQAARIDYKFEWYDNTGMIFDTPESIWRPISLKGREKLPLISISPNARARDFRLKLQESR